MPIFSRRLQLFSWRLAFIFLVVVPNTCYEHVCLNSNDDKIPKRTYATATILKIPLSDCLSGRTSEREWLCTHHQQLTLAGQQTSLSLRAFFYPPKSCCCCSLSTGGVVGEYRVLIFRMVALVSKSTSRCTFIHLPYFVLCILCVKFRGCLSIHTECRQTRLKQPLNE